MISLSNLLKQRYVVNSGIGKRIFNGDEKFVSSNSKAVNKGDTIMDKITGSSIPKAEDIVDGFLAGLVAEEIIVEAQPQFSQEEILQQAQAEAEAIVAAAKTEAFEITEQARQEAEMLCEQKKQEGYQAGMLKMQIELNRKSAQLDADYAASVQTLQQEYEEQMETMEADIVDAVIRVFNKVFHIQFENKRQILLHLIKDTLLGVDAGKEFHIRVAETNYKFIESHVADIKEKIGNDVSIDVINDMTLTGAACIIETETGVFDCSVDMVLSNLEKDIRSLCK